MPMYWLSVEKVILLINWLTCSFYEDILYLIYGCVHRSLNKILTKKHYSQNRRFWGWGPGKIIPTISTVSFFNPTVKFPRLRCIQFVRSQNFTGLRAFPFFLTPAQSMTMRISFSNLIHLKKDVFFCHRYQISLILLR